MHAPIFILFTSTSKIANILKKIQDFNGVWTRDLAITGAMLYQPSYEAAVERTVTWLQKFSDA